MVASVGSFLLSIVAMVGVLLYGKRRPVGAPLSWGEAIAAAGFAFLLLFWAYGVVPHQWLQWANNEMGWTPTKKVLGPGQIFVKIPIIKTITLDYEKVRDFVVIGIYLFYIVAHIGMWALWNDRAKRAERRHRRALAPSTYGRPLVRAKGAR